MRNIFILVVLSLFLSLFGHSQTKSHWGKIIKDATDTRVSNLDVDLYEYNGDSLYQLVENDTIPGYYYFDSVAVGMYDLYIDGGIWYMVTVVFDNPNNQTIMYLNGAQLGNAIAYPAYSAPTDPSVYLRVGRTSATNYFKGWFDEIIMYNATKTSSEILAYYNQYITYPRSGATEVVRGGNNKNNANLKPLGF